VIVDVLDRLELVIAELLWAGDLRMAAVEAVEEVDVVEFVDPPPEAQDVVGRRREEGNRRLVLAKEGVDLRQAGQLFPARLSSHLPPL
jgi:hypothetical protein